MTKYWLHSTDLATGVTIVRPAPNPISPETFFRQRRLNAAAIARAFDVPLELIDDLTWRRRHAPVPAKLAHRRRFR